MKPEIMPKRHKRDSISTGISLLLLIFNVSPASTQETDVPPIAEQFLAFSDEISVWWDDTYLFVDSIGLPNHPMMIGIESWQQQVPLPQDYRGDNSFRIPLNPVILDEPVDTPFMGPIAVAVNGIPIFHHLTQSGNDAFLNGELDDFGGHCGRADDYHYHLPPLHLEATVGEGQPIAYGLDGLPVYAANPSIDKPLDEAHGYFDDEGNYRYVSSETAPYMMGAFRGAALLENQPGTQPIRPPGDPLRGAEITDFSGSLESKYELVYEIDGQVFRVQYEVLDGGQIDFVFIEPDGSTREESYQSGFTSIGEAHLHR